MADEKEIHIEISEAEFNELKDFKDRRGLTWEGVLKHGVLVGN